MVISLSKIIIILILSIFICIIINTLINYYFNKKFSFDIQNTDYIYIDDIRINFMKKGKGEPLLLVHGFIGSILIFENIIDALSKNYTVFALDLIGFGFSDKRMILDYSQKNVAKLAIKFMSKQQVNKFVLLGHSMGGEIALNMDYNYPENIKKLILVSSSGYISLPPLLNLIKKNKYICQLFLKVFLKNYFIVKLSFKFIFFNKDKFGNSVFNRLYSILNHIPLDTLYKLILNADSGEIGDKIKFITVDTLILWGKNDCLFPLIYGKKLSKDLQNSKLIILDNCGHIPFMERPKSFIHIVENYIL